MTYIDLPIRSCIVSKRTKYVPYDRDVHTKAKTLRQLQLEKNKFEDAVARSPQIAMFQEHLAYLTMKIAERIGANK